MRKGSLRSRGAMLLTGMLLITACSSVADHGGATAAGPPAQEATNVDDLLPVDCLLPGQIRQLGQMATYVSRPRSVKTSASDCRIRGGEYVAYDRANYATALRVWLPSAQEGDAEAQTYVGNIYQKGMGLSPDYSLALTWYRKAADQGYEPAQINLALMYERGLGVPKDTQRAIDWYRKASGLPVGELQPASADVGRIDELQQALSREIARSQASRTRAEELERQLANSRSEVTRLQQQRQQAGEKRQDSAREELAKQQAALDSQRQALQAQSDRLRALAREGVRLAVGLAAEVEPSARTRPAQADLEQRVTAAQDEAEKAQAVAEPRAEAAPERLGVGPGSYHALVIGNGDYQHLPNVKTAVADAQAVGQLLQSRFGFATITLLNSTRYQLLSELNKMRDRLSDRDDLVIYYAGHGEIDQVSQRCSWLPVDASPGNAATWIPDVAITDILAASKAKHVLVMADSCYSGLSRSALAGLLSAASAEARHIRIQQMVGRSSRTALTSGGIRPTPDPAGGQHSVFAQAVLNELKNETGVLDGQRLARGVIRKMRESSQPDGTERAPEYAPIQYAGHGGGEFVFAPREARAG